FIVNHSELTGTSKYEWRALGGRLRAGRHLATYWAAKDGARLHRKWHAADGLVWMMPDVGPSRALHLDSRARTGVTDAEMRKIGPRSWSAKERRIRRIIKRRSATKNQKAYNFISLYAHARAHPQDK